MKLQKWSQKHRLLNALEWPFIGEAHRLAVASIRRWMQTFHFALTIDGCELLSKTASEVSLILISQSHVEETKELSHIVPGLLQTTEDALGCITSVLNAVLVLPRVEKDIVDVARCV